MMYIINHAVQMPDCIVNYVVELEGPEINAFH